MSRADFNEMRPFKAPKMLPWQTRIQYVSHRRHLKFIWPTSMSIVRTFKQKLIGRLIINIACPFHKDTAKLVQVLGLLPMIWLRFNLTSITFPIVDSCPQTSQCNNPNWTINQNTSLAAPGTLTHRLQRRTACKYQNPRLLAAPINFG